MQTFETVENIMRERFAKDSLIAVATTDGKRLYNRVVDAYYENGAFYITTYALANKIKQIEANPEVAICAIDWFTGHGIGKNLGWIMDPKNADIRLKLREAFSEWYEHVNNEQDENSCILEIRLTEGLLVKDHFAIRYQVDFTNKSALVSENWGEFK